MNETDVRYLEDQFIGSPIFDNWFKKHYPEKSLLICTPYIKKDAIDRVINLYRLQERGKDFSLRVLIRGNTGEFTAQKSSDISALDSLANLHCLNLENVKRVQNLHMKAYLIDEKYLLLTSGNLTNSGMFVVSGKENFEGGIAVRDPRIIGSFLQYFEGIWSQGQSLGEFYDAFAAAYSAYIETEYSEKRTVRDLNRQKYVFPSRSSVDAAAFSLQKRRKQTVGRKKGDSGSAPSGKVLQYAAAECAPSTQSFTLADIPPVGSFEHLPEVLSITNAHPDGISYLELGRLLRPQFGGSESNTDGTNRKFGEEKGKFAAFLGLVSITDSKHGKLIVSNVLGKTYMSMTRENQEKMIKDIFFDKPIVVSLMRKSLETEDFNLLQFLTEHCEGSVLTLRRKVGPLKELFSHISAICTEAELQEALRRV